MKKTLLSLLFVISLSFISITKAQKIPTLDLFHGAECPHCHKEMKWLPTLQKAYPDLVINKYEVWHSVENQKRMKDRLKELGQSSTAVPTNIIGEDVIVGFNPRGIMAAMEKYYGPPAVAITNEAISDTNNASSQNKDDSELWIIAILALMVIIPATFLVFGKKK